MFYPHSSFVIRSHSSLTIVPQETVFQKVAATSAVVPLDSSQHEMMKNKFKFWTIFDALCIIGRGGIVVILRPRHSNLAQDVEKQGFEAKGAPSSAEASLPTAANSAFDLELKQLMTAAYKLSWYESRNLGQDKTKTNKKKPSESAHNTTETHFFPFDDFSAVISVPTYLIICYLSWIYLSVVLSLDLPLPVNHLRIHFLPSLSL
ncbi:hypothetical protein G6F60_005427 [Rhizopus arrhizus]|nr:hypothetical protein G6F23_004096 [Rhizopus arrhizus]KAG0764633.1 hypothetical protein G6F24_005060 [Rhizopus arrhizus]KAG1298833.1 hypothetical protein G6F66_001370 [Rhizopus arrhizus]KAG1379595.1 hypothetical protein G6F61_004805 [Rhizopus arrhizus]KAG1402860.1 hypothetical protein G6F60_005427 [Rhizopus arrhizus]